MKRKELYDYIREEIINELSEGAATDAAKDAGVSNPAAAAKTAVDTAKKDKTGTATIVGPKGSKVIDKATPLEEDDLTEMASYKFYRIANIEKFDALKDIYAGTIDARVLDAIEAAGEQGLTQDGVAKQLGIKAALINPILKKFSAANALTLPVSEKPGKVKAAEPEVEEPETEEPETEKPESEFFMAGEEDEEEKGMEPIDEPAEPSASDIAAAEKELGTVDTSKIEAANKAANIVKSLTAKIESMKKGPEREKKMAALKQYIKNNRSTVLKGYKISDLTNGLIS